MSHSGDMLIDDESMCNVLNDQFKSVFTREVNFDVTQPLRVQDEFNDDQSNVLSDIYISEEKIANIPKKLRPNKAPGKDDMVPRVLIETAESICKPLCMIFASHLNLG